MTFRRTVPAATIALLSATAACGQSPPPRVIVPDGVEWVAANTKPRTLTFTVETIRITLTDLRDGADVSVSVEKDRGSAGACATAQNVSAQHDIIGRGPHNIQILATLADTLDSFGSLCNVDVGHLRHVSQQKLDGLKR